MKKFLNLHIFDECPAPGAGAAQDNNQNGGAAAQQEHPGAGTYSYAQAEEIATARAQKAERAALASYFKQQGLDENQVTEAINAYKAAQKAKEPDVATLTRERDEALMKAAVYEQRDELAKKGVKPEFTEFVSYKIQAMMKADPKLDTFAKAADKFLKDNQQYGGPGAGTKPAYKVRTATDSGSDGTKAKDDKAAARAALNAAIKAHALRRK